MVAKRKEVFIHKVFWLDVCPRVGKQIAMMARIVYHQQD
jgi:hypothetical protein